MASNHVSFADIYGESLELVRRHFGLLAATGAAIAAGYTALDMLGAAGANLVINLIVSIMVQYLVLERLLADRISQEGKGKRRYGSMLGAGFLSGLGILLGLVALVLPGIYLSGRWLSASSFVVAEGNGSTEALNSSWEASRNSAGAHVIVVMVASLPLVGFLAIAYLAGFFSEVETGLVNSIATNVMTALSTLSYWVFGAGAYRATRPHNAQLEGVFA